MYITKQKQERQFQHLSLSSNLSYDMYKILHSDVGSTSLSTITSFLLASIHKKRPQILYLGFHVGLIMALLISSAFESEETPFFVQFHIIFGQTNNDDLIIQVVLAGLAVIVLWMSQR